MALAPPSSHSLPTRARGLAQRVLRRVDTRHSRLRDESWAYDRRWNIDSASNVSLEGLAVEEGRREHGFIYVPTGPRLFAAFLRTLPSDPSDMTFIDLGSGKGRTLILAAEAGFGGAIGVEFARELHDAALANVTTYESEVGRGKRIACIHADAGAFIFPPGPLVVYLHNPFKEAVMERVLTNLAASLKKEPREVWLCYLELTNEDPEDETENARLIAESGLFESHPVPGGSLKDRFLLSPFNMHVFVTPGVGSARGV